MRKIMTEKQEDEAVRVARLSVPDDQAPSLTAAARGALPAFSTCEQSGMDLRTYLAGQALAGLVSNGQVNGHTVQQVTTLAVDLADALLVRLSTEEPCA